MGQGTDRGSKGIPVLNTRKGEFGNFFLFLIPIYQGTIAVLRDWPIGALLFIAIPSIIGYLSAVGATLLSKQAAPMELNKKKQPFSINRPRLWR